MTHEDKNYRQGRSKRQQDSNEMLAMWGFGGLVVVLLVVMVYNMITSN